MSFSSKQPTENIFSTRTRDAVIPVIKAAARSDLLNLFSSLFFVFFGLIVAFLWVYFLSPDFVPPKMDIFFLFDFCYCPVLVYRHTQVAEVVSNEN